MGWTHSEQAFQHGARRTCFSIAALRVGVAHCSMQVCLLLEQGMLAVAQLHV